MEMLFTDGQEMRWMWKPRQRAEGDKQTIPMPSKEEIGERKDEEEVTVKDVVDQVEKHYRLLSRKQELSG